MISFTEKSPAWEDSHAFDEAVRNAVADDVRERLRLTISAQAELFAARSGERVADAFEVSAEDGAVTVSLPFADGQVEQAVRRELRAAIQKLPVDEIREKVKASDPSRAS